MPSRRSPRRLAILAAVLLAPAIPSAGAAEPAVTIENVRIGYQAGMREGQFKVGTWTPVSVDLKSGPQPFKGFLEVEVPDDEGAATYVRRGVEIPARQFRPGFVVYVRPGARNSDVHVRVLDTRGRVQARVDPSAAWIDGTQQMILTAGATRGVDEVPTLTAFNPPNTSLPPDLIVAAIRIPDGLPSRAEGFDAADVLVLDAGNRELMEALEQGKDVAIRDWVAKSGGHLVVAVGSNWQAIKDSPLAAMLPALPTEQIELRDTQAIEAFADAKKPLAATSMKVAKLQPVEDRRPQYLVATASTPLVVRGTYGFGRVTVVGFDVSEKPFADWPDKKLFWNKVLDVRGRYSGNVAANPVPGAFYVQSASDLSGVLHGSLERFPGVTLVPFGWVAFFVFLYILLIGPGDYFFLKKVLKRMELTWVTFPAIVIVVSLLAYIGAYAAKGTDLKVNKLDIVDLDQTTGQSRGSTFLTLFSPQNRNYDVRVVPLPIDSPSPSPAPTAKAKVSPKIPANTEVTLSWFNGPESNAGVNNRLGLGGSGYSYMPIGGAEELEGVRVPIWSTKSFTARWSGPGAVAVDSDLKPFGSDRLSGGITNRLSKPLKNALLVYGKNVYADIGTIAPGQTVPLDGANTRVLSSWVTAEGQGFNQLNQYQVYNENINVDRVALAKSMMFHSAGSQVGAMTSIPLRYLDLTGQAALGRPMLVAEIDGPASALDLADAPAPAQTQQTTLLRVLLPIAPAADESAEPVREKVVK